jgi:hypothetical protein
MLRSIYRYLVSCHPAPFRRRFGDEMSSIFDCVPVGVPVSPSLQMPSFHY